MQTLFQHSTLNFPPKVSIAPDKKCFALPRGRTNWLANTQNLKTDQDQPQNNPKIRLTLKA